MDNYSVQEESARIFHQHLINNEQLGLPASIIEAAKHVQFVGIDPKPYMPTCCKMTESASALSGFVAATANAICAHRYGTEYQDVQVDTDLATLFLQSFFLPEINGKPFWQHAHLAAELDKGDLYDIQKPIHQQATNIYQTKDGKWYQLHGSLNPKPTMDMLGVQEQHVTHEEAFSIYAKKVKQYDAATLERIANDDFSQPGVACLTHEEFLDSEHGRIISTEPLWTMKSIPAPSTNWPPNPHAANLKPLAGIRVIDFSRAMAGPIVSKLLALFGAEVIKISHKELPDFPITWVDLNTGKHDAEINLKDAEGKLKLAELIAGADVLVDCYRPGVLARLGFDSKSMRKINERLIYLRENCYGFQGPLAHRAGLQQISDCLVGHSWLQGQFLGLDEPVLPPLPNSDYQAGLVGAAVAMLALLERSKGDTAFDIDISLTQYNIWFYRLGQYTDDQCRRLRERNPGFQARHYDGMRTLVARTHAAMIKARPELCKTPEYFTKMSGREWGLDDDISILEPPFRFSRLKLEYEVPSGARGRSKPQWSGGGELGTGNMQSVHGR
ncbi:hypothetical protein MHUMG1_09962 [Metarhizium humberi]|uniref:CAIB/BAIF family enzyme n=1 Tax=Metarhizium humberi TaxID=2596975 RepID=A0A9P8S2V3_9HYPO|nr:hypothetical protein MHUMG1_09962 [Metarhizium humberi]